MNRYGYVFGLLALSGFCLSLDFQLPANRNQLQLWYLQHIDSSAENSVGRADALIDRAIAAGYTGAILWDATFDRLDDPNGSYGDEARLRAVINYAASRRLKMLATAAPFGFALQPAWAEASHVIGSTFKVDRAKKRLIFQDSFPGLKNAGFESGRTEWFDLGDAAVQLDSKVAHAGKYSVVIRNAQANARLRQKLVLKPWRQYHLRLFYKTDHFHGYGMVELLAPGGGGPFSTELKAKPFLDWTELDYAFNSRNYTEVYLYFGVWGGCSGTIWFDDAQLSETALVYLLRAKRAPLVAYDPNNLKRLFVERTDFDYIEDPRLEERHPFYDSYHEPPIVKLPIWSHLRDGQLVALSYYAVFPLPPEYSVAMCLTDERVLKWLNEDVRGIKRVLPPGAGIMMQYDEIRQMNSCGSCRSRKMTAGQLLAWNVAYTIHTFESVMPEAPLYTWSDMFDPYHNAVSHYFYVEGDLAGSWKALPSNVTIVNWNLGRLKESLTWFSGQDPRQPVAHEQIIAGYYDQSDGATAASEELRQAAGIPGIKGIMYTTWGDNFKQFEAFANAARSHWPEYLASLSH